MHLEFKELKNALHYTGSQPPPLSLYLSKATPPLSLYLFKLASTELISLSGLLGSIKAKGYAYSLTIFLTNLGEIILKVGCEHYAKTQLAQRKHYLL